MQARLDAAAASAREREHGQQLGAKDTSRSALERELATLAGQLVGAQAELKASAEAAAARDATHARERTSLMQTVQALEREKEEGSNALRGAEGRIGMLMEQLAQAAGDREFCYEVISDLRAQLGSRQQQSQCQRTAASGALLEVKL